MEIKLGNLTIVDALSNERLMAHPVAAAIKGLPGRESVGVAEIDPSVSDTAAFCERYGVGMDQSANCVILKAKKEGREWLAACVILGSTRADVNGAGRKALDARKVSFAPMEEAVEKSGMEFGAITPVGLPSDWPILLDSRVADAPYVIIGSGIRKSKIAIPGNVLASLPNALVIEGLAINR